MSNRARSAASLPIRDVVRSYLKTRHMMLPVSIARVSQLARDAHPSLSLPNSLLADLIAREALSAGRSIHFDSKEGWPQFSMPPSSRMAAGSYSIDRDHGGSVRRSSRGALARPEPSIPANVV